jgi:hypothetical protein
MRNTYVWFAASHSGGRVIEVCAVRKVAMGKYIDPPHGGVVGVCRTW